MSRIVSWLSLALAVLLSACGSAPGTPPAIQITSHTDGQLVTNGNRNITLSGTGSRMASVQVKLNGTALPASAVTSTDSTFTASLALANNSNTIEAIATNSGGSASSGVVTVVYPFVTFTTFQNASVVIGQAKSTGAAANRGGTPDANTINAPWGNALVSGGKLYLPDSGNNRVLVYSSVPTTDGARADQVLGQLGFTTATSGTTADKFQSPATAAVESGKLLVVDCLNYRVVIFSSIPTSSGAAADVAVGADDPTTRGFGCAPNRLKPQSIFVVNGKLLVADSGNNRVLIWNSIPTASGASADLVLGQTGFTYCGQNAGASASASTLNEPTDVWSDGTRLVVADTLNNRVLIWNTFPAESNTPANVVVGQTYMTSTASATTQTGLNGPTSVSSNGNQLFVADGDTNRVLVWNTFPTTWGAAADVVLGQGDFTHAAENDDDQNGGPDATPTARTLNYPTGVALWGNQLFVTDHGNNRYLIFDGQ